MRYLILLILILFLISGEVYAEKTTCRSIQKNPFHEIVTVTTFWGHYRGYIFGKTGEILDMEKNKIMERIPDYIKKKCKINKRINIFNELVFQGIKDEFKVKEKKEKIHIYGWKNFKFGMEGNEVKNILKSVCKTNPFQINEDSGKVSFIKYGGLKEDYKGKWGRQDTCYTIGGMKTSSEEFRFKNNELVRIKLRISFTSDKKTHEKKKKIGGYPNLISQKQINEYKEMLVNALKKKYQLTYEGKYRENEQIREDLLVLGNGQLLVLFKQNKTYSYRSIELKYMSLGKDQKQILDHIESIKKN